MLPVLRAPPAPRALPVLLVLPALPVPQVLQAPPAPRVPLVLLALLALQAPRVPRVLPVLLVPRRQSFMRNVSDSFSADFAELLLVILYVLCNTAVLVCIIKFDLDTLILMDIDCVDKLHQQATG